MAEGFLSRRQFVAGSAALAMAGMFGALTGCTAGGSGAAAGADTASASTGGDAASSTDPITMVWLPDNSSADLTSSREAIGAAITAACSREANLLTTTDYNVAIESIASGKAQMALLGPEGYVQANKKNPKVLAAFTNSDEDGGLDGTLKPEVDVADTNENDLPSMFSMEKLPPFLYWSASYLRTQMRL